MSEDTYRTMPYYYMADGIPTVIVEEIVPLKVSKAQVRTLRRWSTERYYIPPPKSIQTFVRRGLAMRTLRAVNKKGKDFEYWYTQQEANGMRNTGVTVLDSGVRCYVENGSAIVEVQEVVRLEVTAAQVKVLREIDEFTVYYAEGTKDEKIGFALVRRGLATFDYELPNWTRRHPKEPEPPEDLVFMVTDKGREFLRWLDEQEGQS
jgi:hypothetical protein